MSKDLAILESLNEGTPMQQMLGGVLEELGGMSFVTDWAEEYPTDFMRFLMAQYPVAQAHQGGGGTNVQLVIHPALQPGPLDVVSDQ